MSWIQSFFDFFKKEEEVLDEEYQLHKSAPTEEKESSKDLDARVAYQYPKGNFRFPIIPDDTKKIHDRRGHAVHHEKKPTEPKHTSYHHVDKLEKSTAKKQSPVKSKTYGHGPFRPTEIPSPIFGFNNRPKKPAVEHELSHFSKGTDLQNESLSGSSYEIDGNKSRVWPLETIDHASLSNQLLKKRQNVQEDKADEMLQMEFPQAETEKAVDSIQRNIEEKKPYSVPLTEAGVRLKEKTQPAEPSAEEIVFAREKLEPAEPLAEEIVFAQEKLKPAEPSAEEIVFAREKLEPAEPLTEEIVLAQEKSELIERLEKEIDSVQEETQPVEPLAEEIVLAQEKLEPAEQVGMEIDLVQEETQPVEPLAEEIVLAQEKLEPAEQVGMEIDPVQEETQPAEPLAEKLVSTQEENAGFKGSEVNVEQESEKTKRQHLPFNVLMLKQDKQKWEEKSTQHKRFHQNLLEDADAKKTETMEKGVAQEPVQFPEEDNDYEFPAFQLLNPPIAEGMDTEWLLEQEQLLNQTLENFNVGAMVVNMTQGPSVTRFEVQPEPGVKVNKVTNLTDDIKLSLAARDIRIEAPIPGKHTIGIEVPNQKSRPVLISEIIQSKVFAESSSPLTAVLGLDISGKPIVTDLKKMPHGLIAGATGSGKSVCINTILISLLYKASPLDLKLLLIDPKMVELAPYNQIPHLVSPVITDVKAATAALKWAVDEMERRYELFAHTGVRDINRFNELAMQHKRYSDKLPFIVIVIDELADLMMMSPADVEEAICRIAQKARACGIHLIIATQRPSVDVITGLIKANIPTRIAFSVSSQVDSRTIIDISGAEKLLGRGDMLFLENGSSKPVRLQGTFVSDQEIDDVVEHVREQREPDYLFEQEELLKKAQVTEEEDELFYEACEFVIDQDSASTSGLQRRFKIGYNRAARLMDMMEQQGYISGSKGSKGRDVLITPADLEAMQEVSS